MLNAAVRCRMSNRPVATSLRRSYDVVLSKKVCSQDDKSEGVRAGSALRWRKGPIHPERRVDSLQDEWLS